MYIGVHVKNRLLLSGNNDTWNFKYSNVRFQENPFRGIRVVPCGRTDEQT